MKNKIRYSIRLKVILISVSILFISIGAMTLVSSYIFSRIYTRVLITNAYVIGQNLRMKLDRLLELGFRLENINNLDRYSTEILAEHNDISYVAVTDPGGNIIFHSENDQQQSKPYTPGFINKIQYQDFVQNTIHNNKQKYYETILPVFRILENQGNSKEFIGIISIGFPVKVIKSKVRAMILFSTGIAILAFGGSLFILIFFLSHWITKPITRLVKVIQEIKEDDVLTNKVPVNSSDEIGWLAETFNKMTLELDKNRRMQVEKKRIEMELEIAKLIQTSLLPRINRLKQDLYEISATMIPATEVGGDYYDIIQDRNGRIWIGIGDVTGHGVMSGLIMMMLQTAAFSYINQDPMITPAELVIQTNQVLFENIRMRMQIKRFMTLSFLAGNREGEFEYAGKHLPVIIFRKKERKCEVINVQGFWEGILPDIAEKTETITFKLEPDDILFLYSDGILESINKSRRLYGFERFLDSIQKHCRSGNKGAQEILDAVIADLFTYMEIQRDDISLVVLKKKNGKMQK